jgi:hypothetical protein
VDLGLLVHARHERAVRRVEVESDDVTHLVDELRVRPAALQSRAPGPRELERLALVRLQAEAAPDRDSHH